MYTGSKRVHHVRLKVVEDTPILSAAEMLYSPKNVVSFMVILAWIAPSESVKVRHSPLASEKLTNNLPCNLKTVQDRR